MAPYVFLSSRDRLAPLQTCESLCTFPPASGLVPVSVQKTIDPGIHPLPVQTKPDSGIHTIDVGIQQGEFLYQFLHLIGSMRLVQIIEDHGHRATSSPALFRASMVLVKVGGSRLAVIVNPHGFWQYQWPGSGRFIFIQFNTVKRRSLVTVIRLFQVKDCFLSWCGKSAEIKK